MSHTRTGFVRLWNIFDFQRLLEEYGDEGYLH